MSAAATRSAEVVVVGGGIVGASIAYVQMLGEPAAEPAADA